MMSRARSMTTTTMLLLATLALMIPTAALADPPAESGVVERAPRVSAWLIHGSGLFVVTGPPIAQGCLGFPDFPDLPEYPATIVTTPTGATLTTITHTQHVEVFDDQGFDNVFAWLGTVCPAVLAGEPAPEPLAQGEGQVRVRSRVDADGVEHGRVIVTARLTTADGEHVHLNTHGEIGMLFSDFVNYGG